MYTGPASYGRASMTAGRWSTCRHRPGRSGPRSYRATGARDRSERLRLANGSIPSDPHRWRPSSARRGYRSTECSGMASPREGRTRPIRPEHRCASATTSRITGPEGGLQPVRERAKLDRLRVADSEGRERRNRALDGASIVASSPAIETTSRSGNAKRCAAGATPEIEPLVHDHGSDALASTPAAIGSTDARPSSVDSMRTMASRATGPVATRPSKACPGGTCRDRCRSATAPSAGGVARGGPAGQRKIGRAAQHAGPSRPPAPTRARPAADLSPDARCLVELPVPDPHRFREAGHGPAVRLGEDPLVRDVGRTALSEPEQRLRLAALGPAGDEDPAAMVDERARVDRDVPAGEGGQAGDRDQGRDGRGARAARRSSTARYRVARGAGGTRTSIWRRPRRMISPCSSYAASCPGPRVPPRQAANRRTRSPGPGVDRRPRAAGRVGDGRERARGRQPR